MIEHHAKCTVGDLAKNGSVYQLFLLLSLETTRGLILKKTLSQYFRKEINDLSVKWSSKDITSNKS